MAMSELDDDDAFEGDLDGDGGSFDDGDSAFDDGVDDPDEGPEGSFRENHDVFSTPSSAPEPHANPLTNKAQEAAQYMTPQPSALDKAKKNGVLVAKWMSSNPADFRVAWASRDGTPAEAWRHPTRSEFDKFKNQGRWLKGGVKQPQQMQAGSMAGIDASDAQSFWQKHKTKFYVAGGVVAVGSLGWWLYKTYWAEANSEVRTTR